MTIKQIYEKYSTPKNLQVHMLRVAALSRIICDNWKGSKIEVTEIVKACSLHDIAKPVIFDLEKQAAYGIGLEEIAKLKDFQKLIKSKYGENEHEATVLFCMDLGLSSNALKILKNIKWQNTYDLINNNDIESFISVYCDMRISPNGILKIEDRIKNLQGRYNPDKYDYEDLGKKSVVLEHKIQENINFDLNTVTNNDLNNLFPELLDLEI